MAQAFQTPFRNSQQHLRLYTCLASWLLHILVWLSEGNSISLYLLHILLCNFSIMRKNKNRWLLLLPVSPWGMTNCLQTYLTVLCWNFHAVCFIWVFKTAYVMSQNILYILVFIFSLKKETYVIQMDSYLSDRRKALSDPPNPRDWHILSNLAKALQQSIKLVLRSLTVIHALCLCLLIVFLIQSLSKEKRKSSKGKHFHGVKAIHSYHCCILTKR